MTRFMYSGCCSLTFCLVIAGKTQLQQITLSMDQFHLDVPVNHARASGCQDPVSEPPESVKIEQCFMAAVDHPNINQASL